MRLCSIFNAIFLIAYGLPHSQSDQLEWQRRRSQKQISVEKNHIFKTTHFFYFVFPSLWRDLLFDALNQKQSTPAIKKHNIEEKKSPISKRTQNIICLQKIAMHRLKRSQCAHRYACGHWRLVRANAAGDDGFRRVFECFSKLMRMTSKATTDDHEQSVWVKVISYECRQAIDWHFLMLFFFPLFVWLRVKIVVRFQKRIYLWVRI